MCKNCLTFDLQQVYSTSFAPIQFTARRTNVRSQTQRKTTESLLPLHYKCLLGLQHSRFLCPNLSLYAVPYFVTPWTNDISPSCVFFPTEAQGVL